MTEVRWLTMEEQRIWRSFLVVTRLLFSEFERDLQRGASIPLAYYEILSVLSESEQRVMRMNELSEVLEMSPSRLSHAVSRLEGEGWVRRELCPSDRRGWLAVLTEEGVKALQEAAPCHVESVRRRLFDQLTPEQVDALGSISRSLLTELAPGHRLIPGVYTEEKA